MNPEVPLQDRPGEKAPLQFCPNHETPILYRSLRARCPWCADRRRIAELESAVQVLERAITAKAKTKKKPEGC